MITDDELYDRGAETMLSSWARVAAGSPGARVVRADGVAAGVFPAGPERAIYNNALLGRGAGAAAVDAMEALYAAAGIGGYAAWVHEGDAALRELMGERGYRVTETTRAMGMALADLAIGRPALALEPAPWPDYVRFLEREGAPAGLLAGVDPAGFELLLARRDGEAVATALAHDRGDDRGIYNVGTLEAARRQGLGTALTALLLHGARDRGARTATLQSTPMGERLYRSLGFRDLGRFLEFTRPG
jgi:ribosomal protein S18 acetylase RimI-like enzyme